MKKLLVFISLFISFSCVERNKKVENNIVSEKVIVSEEIIYPIFLGINPNMGKIEINQMISKQVKEGNLVQNGESYLYVLHINEENTNFYFAVRNDKISLSYSARKVYPLKNFNNQKEKSFTKLLDKKVKFLRNHFSKKYPNKIDLKTRKKLKNRYKNFYVFRDSIKTIIIDYYSEIKNEYINLSSYFSQENPEHELAGLIYDPSFEFGNPNYDKSNSKYFSKGKDLTGAITISYYDNNDFTKLLDDLHQLELKKEESFKRKNDSLNKIKNNINEL